MTIQHQSNDFLSSILSLEQLLPAYCSGKDFANIRSICEQVAVKREENYRYFLDSMASLF